MRKYATASVLVVASVIGAVAQSTSPLSTDNRANITPQTHCKDKGQVWLKSSAELAGRTNRSRDTTSGAASTAPAPRASTPVESPGGRT